MGAGVPRRTSRLRAALIALPFVCAFAACGETRHAPGEACLRGDDCLSGFCTDRICVAAPPLGKPQTGGTTDAGSAPDDASGSSADGASTDARVD